MNQVQFDQDLKVAIDDTTDDTVPLPEDEEFVDDNPIKVVFEELTGGKIREYRKQYRPS